MDTMWSPIQVLTPPNGLLCHSRFGPSADFDPITWRQKKRSHSGKFRLLHCVLDLDNSSTHILDSLDSCPRYEI